ncbi:MAG: mechanosensitive ion channel [Candidatus Methanomethylophilaceae archaeon]|nr:mechanosensitive ion channel [Candidatus Methanomethylophilaceae archaeon]
MKSKMMAALVLTLLVAGIIAPILPLEGSDGLSPNEFSISIPGTEAPEKPISISLGNGESASWNINVVNRTTEKYLEAKFTVASECSDIEVAEKPSNGLIVPMNGVDHANVLSGILKITINDYVDLNENAHLKLIIDIDDVDDKLNPTSVTVDFDIEIKTVFDTSSSYNKFLEIFENRLPAPFNSPIVPFLATIVFWMVIAALATRLIAPRLAKALDKHTSTDDALKFEKAISKLILILVFFLSIDQGLSILGADAVLISDFVRFSFIIYVVITLLIAWKIYLVLAQGILSRFEDNDESTIDMSLLPLLKMIGKIFFWVVGAAAILGSLGVDLQGILVSAGVVSLGITMGAQNVLSQFFSGIVLLMTRPFKKGDFLKINDKVYIVQKVRLMFTEFTGWDKDQIITMPNNAVTAATIVNLTREDEAYRLYVYFSVAYGVDLKKAEEVMLKVANESPVVLHDSEHAAPNVRMTGFEDSGIELRLGVTVRDFNGTITDASALRMAVYQAFVDNDIEIPYNRLEVTMLNDCFKGEKRPGDVVSD